jgi:hypothetical protein
MRHVLLLPPDDEIDQLLNVLDCFISAELFPVTPE